MTEIKINIRECEAEIHGHAYSDIAGKDIVCAALSALMLHLETNVIGDAIIEKAKPNAYFRIKAENRIANENLFSSVAYTLKKISMAEDADKFMSVKIDW